MSTFNTSIIAVTLTISINGGKGSLTVPVTVVETTEWFEGEKSMTTYTISQQDWENLQAKYGLKHLTLWGLSGGYERMMAFGRI